jgi:hypothetical protein
MEVSGQLQILAISPLGKEAQVPVKEEVMWAPEMVRMLLRRGKSLAHAMTYSIFLHMI